MLGDQNVTPPGTHPVVFLFHDFSECQFSFPTSLRSMKFREQTVGIPFTYMRNGASLAREAGPYYFMPKLYLDDLWVYLNGVFWWGFNKEMATVAVTGNRYTVASLTGEPLALLEWSAYGGGGPREPAGYPGFEPMRRMLSQPLISVFPAASGPLFSLTDFDRRWNLTTVQPLDSVLNVASSYLPGFKCGSFTLPGGPREIGSSLPESFELSGPWWLSLPYNPSLPFSRYPDSVRSWYS